MGGDQTFPGAGVEASSQLPNASTHVIRTDRDATEYWLAHASACQIQTQSTQKGFLP
jgi:hypothetical protein